MLYTSYSYKIQNNFSYYETHYTINIKITTQSFSCHLEKKIHNKNKFYVSHIYFTIYFLCQSTRIHVPLFCCSLVSLGCNSALVNVKFGTWKGHGRGVQCGEILGEKKSQKAERRNPRCCYNGHFEQPHSRAVSISSEYEDPSVQRKTTFRFLLLVTPQQTPGGAAAWQDRGQSMRGILPVDVQVLKGWCLFSCSRIISP